MPRSSSNRPILRRDSSGYTPAVPTSSPVGSPPSAITQNTHTFMQSVTQGLGFGMGNAIAHKMFGSNPTMANAETVASERVVPAIKPIYLSTEYTQCMKESENNDDACRHLLDALIN